MRVLTSPLPHSVKETKAFNSFEKDYCFRIPLKKPKHLPYSRIIEHEENWALNQNFEDGKNWVLNQNVKMEIIGYCIKVMRVLYNFADFLFFPLLGHSLPA